MISCNVHITFAGNVQGEAVNNTLWLGYSIPWISQWPIGVQVGSAIILGIEEVYRRQILPGYRIDFVWRDSGCIVYHGIRNVIDMWSSVDDIDAIIGDGCSVVCQPLSFLAEAWGIPVISFGCTSDSLSDKTTYPTFTRVEGTWAILAPALRSLSDQFEWNR